MSLIELCVVLVIMAALGGIAAPRFGYSLAIYRCKQAAQRVAADVGYAQWQAKTTTLGQSVVYSTTTNSYTLTGVAALSGGGTTYAVNLSADPYQAALVTASFGSGSTLTFDRYGQPSTGGTVVVQVGGVQNTVTVDATTGKASVQ